MAFFVRPLTYHEQILLKEISEQYKDNWLIQKRANIILLSHQRLKSGEIARRLDVASPTALSWIKRFNQQGMGCFEQLWKDSDKKDKLY